MKGFKNFLLTIILFALLGWGAGILFTVFLEMDGAFAVEALYAQFSWIGALVGAFLGALFPFLKKNRSKNAPNATTRGKTSTGKEHDIHFDAHFLTEKEILSDKFLINTTWKGLPSVKNTGFVVRNTLEGSTYKVTMKDGVHVLIIGTTGSGKTTIIIEPTIRILARTAEKPCFVIGDPKGELYENHSEYLRQEGYKVVVYDLDDPFISSRWNPMERSFNMYQRAMNIYKEAKKYSRCTPEQMNLRRIEGYIYSDTFFGFNDVAFPTEDMLKSELNSFKQQLINDAMFDLRGVASSVCPVDPNTSDKTWEQGAQDYLFGIMIAMLEDSQDERLGDMKLRADQFNFYNLYKIANKKDEDPDAPFKSIQKYCSGRLKTSDVPGLTSTVVNNAPNTMRSYMGVLSGKISALMQDMGICYATSGSDLRFESFVEQPTAFFIKIPDHKKERHPLATIAIAQLYRSLVDIANKFPGKKIPRHIYFLLDEFGNLPVIPDFATMVTVSRSRNIFFEIVVQSFTQLDTKYGKEIAETLKGNFNAHVFLGTEDQVTKEAFSKSCGEIQLLHEEESSSRQEGGKDSSGGVNKSKSIQRTNRPLIDPYELSQIPFGTGIVKMFRMNPLKVRLTPWFKTPFFKRIPAKKQVVISKSLDVNKIGFDIIKRNEMVFGKPKRWSDF